MLLKVGELARRCGLTVRALHHYDAIGLLTPSARSESGYRLYNRDDIARLHQIQALRRFGLPLSDIGTVLANPDNRLAAIIGRQIEHLDKEMEQASKLRERLSQLQGQLLRGEAPESAEWLATLELMQTYDKYFSAQEQQRFPLLNAEGKDIGREWRELVDTIHQAMNAGRPPTDPGIQALARRWIAMLERDTNGDPRLLAKLNAMHQQEPMVQVRTGVTPEVIKYIQNAWIEIKLALYKKHLSPQEFRFLQQNYRKRYDDWPVMIGAIRQHMEDGSPPDHPDMLRLAAEWLGLFRSYAGDNPETQAKIRHAYEVEPELLVGSFIDRPLLEYVRTAMARLEPGHAPAIASGR